MQPLAVNGIGVNPFRLFGRMELHTLWTKKICRWNYLKWSHTNQDPMVKGLWQTWTFGHQNIWKRIRCLAMQEAAGTICVIWTRIIPKLFAVAKHPITGTR